MKKLAFLLSVVLIVFSFSSCSKSTVSVQPELEQIRSICKLATLQCYYHNVAKSVKPAGSGFSAIGEKDRKLWIEYTGTARVGIDMMKVSMEITENKVTIHIPKAELLDINISDSSFDENSFVASADGINKNKITAEDQTQAIETAQKVMAESVKNDTVLLLKAQEKAKDLIENYINQINQYSNNSYEIEWDLQNGESNDEQDTSDAVDITDQNQSADE